MKNKIKYFVFMILHIVFLHVLFAMIYHTQITGFIHYLLCFIFGFYVSICSFKYIELKEKILELKEKIKNKI